MSKLYAWQARDLLHRASAAAEQVNAAKALADSDLSSSNPLWDHIMRLQIEVRCLQEELVRVLVSADVAVETVTAEAA